MFCCRSLEEKVRAGVSKHVEIALVTRVQTPDVPLADAREVVLHLAAVVARDSRRDGGVRHQPADAGGSEDVLGVPLQRLVVAHHVVLDLAGRTQLRVRRPVDDGLAELLVQVAPAFGVA